MSKETSSFSKDPPMCDGSLLEASSDVHTGFRKSLSVGLDPETKSVGMRIFLHQSDGVGIKDYVTFVPSGELNGILVAIVASIKRRYKRAGVISVPSKFDKVNGMQQWEDVVEVYGDKKVYEYMENGSLAQKLHSDMLDWGKRFDIAVGIAKGLAYLHEECLEWVLHCDVKPHNILLDNNCKPKVADFGLCKLLDRDRTHNTEFTKARGTRGYMATEWLFLNRPITSKVDVYSYGVVILEMITGRSPADEQSEEDMDARPTMTQVVHMLLHVEEGDDYEENGIESLPLLK
ncbi:putative receptor protein kinase ZmPK1, partial [Tanacetum coccineum]